MVSRHSGEMGMGALSVNGYVLENTSPDFLKTFTWVYYANKKERPKAITT